MYDQNKMIPSLIEEYLFLKEVDSCALRNASFNLEDAYQNFFTGLWINKSLGEVEISYRKVRRIKIYFDFCSV